MGKLGPHNWITVAPNRRESCLAGFIYLWGKRGDNMQNRPQGLLLGSPKLLTEVQKYLY